MEVRALQNLRDFLTTGMGKDLAVEYRENKVKLPPQGSFVVNKADVVSCKVELINSLKLGSSGPVGE